MNRRTAASNVPSVPRFPKGGHLRVFLGKQASILPMHGSSKEIGKGLEHRIKKDLGLE
jgi:hypothetical protein